MMPHTFVNPFTDFGFKRLFGTEPNKGLLISFLNTLLPAKHQIQDLQYTKNEYQGYTVLDRKAIFDLTCMSTTGERFIVELQKAKQNFFKDRSVYYATFPIQEQAIKGDWDFKLAAVYTVGILDFVFEEDIKNHDADVVHTVQLKNQHNKLFYDKLTFIYITLPQFKKDLNELKTIQDKWFYAFRHLAELDAIPSQLQEKVFLQLFEAANIAKFNPVERQAYEDSLKYYRDLKNVTDTARDEGKEEGIEIGMALGEQKAMKKTIKALKNSGMTVELIANSLSLSEVVVLELLKED
ncbi:MAG: PD-(D/E)XK nuclease family transposase [Pseudomonadales bacterium]|nr:PD-(D/E)XK nuclease family transposase [Pseudomonadales bacterium]